jgi:hypothetical protein
METKEKKQVKMTNKVLDSKEIKKLSKVGEWLRSGKSIGHIVDMRAVLQ